jgi:hypothetical protein
LPPTAPIGPALPGHSGGPAAALRPPPLQAEQLQAVMQMINRKYGKGSIQRLGLSGTPPNL